MDPRLTHIPFLRCDAGKGSAGFSHLVKSIEGIIIPKVSDAKDIVFELTGDANIDVVYLPENGRHWGQFDYKRKIVFLFGRPRLSTLIHEVAHHIDYFHYGKVGHGRTFKNELYKLYVEIEFLLDLDVIGKAADIAHEVEQDNREASYLMGPGTLVRVVNDEAKTLYTVTRHMTKNYAMTRVADGVKFKINPKYLKPADE